MTQVDADSIIKSKDAGLFAKIVTKDFRCMTEGDTKLRSYKPRNAVVQHVD